MDSVWKHGILLLTLFLVTTGNMYNEKGIFNGQDGEEKRLIDNLLVNYNKYARPRLKLSQPVTVLVDLVIVQIEDLTERQQVLKTHTWVRMEWWDMYLRWNSSMYEGLDKIMLPLEKIWVPELVVENSAKAIHEIFGRKPEMQAVVWNDGHIFVVFGEHIVSLCSLDLTYYPFDDQRCVIRIGNWISEDRLVRTRNAFNGIDYSPYQESGQWYIIGGDAQLDIFQSTSAHTDLFFPAINYEVLLKRKPFYNTVYMALPSFILSLVALLMFWIPPESGEKVSLGITVFLAFSVLMFSLSDDLPESSNSFPIIGFYLMFVMNSTAFWLLLTVGILNMHNKGPDKYPPKWLESFAVNGLAKILCMNIRHEGNKSEQTNGNVDTLLSHESGENERHGTKNKRISWMKIAKIFDRFFLVLFSIISLIAMIIFLCFYPIQSTISPKDFHKEKIHWNYTDFET